MALGVVSAIHHAQASGKGQFLDVSMYDAMLAFQKSAVAQFGFTGRPNPAGLQRAMTLYPFDLFPTKDGRIAIAAVHRGLRPLDSLGQQIAELDEHQLERRFLVADDG